jgi:dipeptidyl aminopeptidase/acylaminoacyl peptidase
MISTLEQGDDGKLAVISASDHKSDEIYAYENGQLRALTHHNDKLFAELKLGAVEEFSCNAKDGNEVHGLVVKPPDFQAGKKSPPCCASTADRMDRTPTRSTSSASSSPPTAMLWSP